MQIVDANVGNQVTQNAVPNDRNEVGQNAVQNPGIQSTQEEFEFMTAADAHKEIERVKVNCTSEDTLQQASTSGTQFDNAPVYDSNGSAENLKDSSDPTTTINKALDSIAKAFKFNTIPTNNNQRSSLIPRNSQIVQPDMNTSQDIKMQMVDANVGNQVTQNAMQNDRNEYGIGNFVIAPAEGNGNGINDAHKEIERVKVNCTSEDTLQQASTSGTQFDNAPVYDSNGSAEGLFGNSRNTQCGSNDFSNPLIKFLSNGFMDLHGNTQRPTNCCSTRSYKAVNVRYIHYMIHQNRRDLPRNTPLDRVEFQVTMTKVIKEEFEQLGILKISDDLFTYDTQLGMIFSEFKRLSRINDDLFTYEIKVPKPTPCDEQQTSNPTHNDIGEYEWKISYEECEKIYDETVIFINKRLVRLIDVTVEQWLDLKYGNHETIDKNVKKEIIGSWLIRSYKLQFKEYLEIKRQRDTYAREVEWLVVFN
nr:hypothetical protein [Tanacetum cinerariifolium]